MTSFQAVVLFVSGVLAGGLNALAGGGGFITLPILMWSGASPILANTTGTIAVWPGLIATLYAYRRSLKPQDHPLTRYALFGAVGSGLGACLLLFTTNDFFMGLLPWLMLFATVLFIFGGKITGMLTARTERGVSPLVAQTLLFLIAIYGGYFGGGMGIMTLAVLALIGMHDMHEMNALKSLMVFIINGVGVLVFVAQGKVEWSRCLVMVAGCVAGGYGAGRLVRTLNPARLRVIIALYASGMTVYFFFRAYIAH